MTETQINNKRNKNTLLIVAVLVIIGSLFWAYKEKVRTIKIPEKNEISGEAIAQGGKVPYLVAPEGYTLTYFAKDLPGARVIDFDPHGRMLVSQTKEGKISTLLDSEGDGIAEDIKTLVSGLKNPHGMAWRCESDNTLCTLYVATSNALLSFPYDVANGTVGVSRKLATIGYSSTDNHFTRSLLFLPAPEENILLISVGSSCNVCNESDPHHAKILAYDIKTGKLEEYARGLRNAVFLTLSPLGKVFTTEMGRDALGDDVPPDEINIIEKGKNYGWPICYGKNIHDDNFDKNTYIRNPCMEPLETQSFVDLQAHSAPLGLSFIPQLGWEEEYQDDLLVAYHGSWNRSVPTGYKIVRIEFDASMNYLGTTDFITGWLSEDGKKNGRPADIRVLNHGLAYISDDSAGVIYKLSKE